MGDALPTISLSSDAAQLHSTILMYSLNQLLVKFQGARIVHSHMNCMFWNLNVLYKLLFHVDYWCEFAFFS